MNIDTAKMIEYAEFLEESSKKLLDLCKNIELDMELAVHCMDQQSGKSAAQRIAQNLEIIKKNILIFDETGKKLILAKKYIDSARNVFGG